MNTTYNLIVLAVNLLLVLSFSIVYSRMIRQKMFFDVNDTGSPLWGLLLLAGVAPFGVLCHSCTSAFQSMLDIEMAGELQFVRLCEFLGIYAAIIIATTLVTMSCSYVVWKITISDGKSLKLAMDDRQISSALMILGVSIMLAFVVSAPLESLLEGFIHYPTSPVFR